MQHSEAHVCTLTFSPGSGCSYLERVISDTSDSSVTADVYLASLQEYISSDDTTQAIKELRECFLKQSEETLENFSVFMVISAFSDVLLETGTRRLKVCHSCQSKWWMCFISVYCIVWQVWWLWHQERQSRPQGQFATWKNLSWIIREKGKRGKRPLRHRTTYPSPPLPSTHTTPLSVPCVQACTHTRTHTHFLSK